MFTVFPVEIFTHVKQLRNVMLENCQISTIPAGAFKHADALFFWVWTKWIEKNWDTTGAIQLITVSLNQIDEIVEGAFADMHWLQNLYLNHSKVLSPRIFETVKLSRLQLRGNLDRNILVHKLSEIHTELSVEKISKPFFLENFSTDFHFYLNNNRLTDLPKLTKFISPDHLNVCNNPLTVLASSAKFPRRLESLDLTDTGVKFIGKPFKGLPKLKVLLLGGNNLSAVNQKWFDGVADLQKLSLKSNNLNQHWTAVNCRCINTKSGLNQCWFRLKPSVNQT